MRIKRFKNFLKYFFTALLLIGVVLTIGFLSFTGMLVIFSSLPLAAIAFILAGVIEGEVYAQNIFQGFKKLFRKNDLDNTICLNALKELLTKKNIKRSIFLKNYQEHLNYIHEQEEKENLDKESKKELENAKKELKLMERCFRDFVKDQNDLENPLGENILSKDKKDSILAEIKNKVWLTRLCLFVSCLAGLGMGFVFLSVVPEGIIGAAAFFGITLTATAFPLALTVGIYILAPIAAAGYIMLIYNTLKDIIQNNVVQKWFKRIREFFSLSEPLTLKSFLKIAGITLCVVLVVALAILATITTAGTWWYAAKAGAHFIMPALKTFSEVISGLTVAVMGLSTLAFNVYNSLQSVKEVSKITLNSFKQKFKEIKNKILNYFNKENLVQFLNPFRMIIILITCPFKILAFIGHSIAIGLTGDRFDPIPGSASVVIGGVSDAFVDAHFIFEAPHAIHSESPAEHEHIKHNLPQKEKASKHDHLHDHTKKPHSHSCHDDEPHNHTHTDLPGKFLLVILSPLYVLSALWDYAWSRLNSKKTFSDQLRSSNNMLTSSLQEKPQKLSFVQSLKKAFRGIEALTKIKAPSSPKLNEHSKKILNAHILHKLKNVPAEEKKSFEKLLESFKTESSKTIDDHKQNQESRAFLEKITDSDPPQNFIEHLKELCKSHLNSSNDRNSETTETIVGTSYTQPLSISHPESVKILNRLALINFEEDKKPPLRTFS